jgi:hypothetical protein
MDSSVSLKNEIWFLRVYLYAKHRDAIIATRGGQNGGDSQKTE